MSLTGRLGGRAAPEHDVCFYCWGPLDNPAIEWSGSTGFICLHPGCVVELAIRLVRDVHEVESRTGRYVMERAS
jgi:hypothetical protein